METVQATGMLFGVVVALLAMLFVALVAAAAADRARVPVTKRRTDSGAIKVGFAGAPYVVADGGERPWKKEPSMPGMGGGVLSPAATSCRSAQRFQKPLEDSMMATTSATRGG